MKGAVPNKDTPPSWSSHPSSAHLKPSLGLELSKSRERVEVLRRGAGVRRSSPFFYLYESEGVVREKCWGVTP